MEEVNFIRPQEVYNRNTGESKVRYTSYDGRNRFIPVVDREKGVPRTLVETTHAELKAMRDAGKLTPGALYRITDYQCTTTQENTKSAGHQFDIVLLALSENKLAEEGWAMEHPTDVYDVTFGDGVTLKCYLYFFDDETDCNIVLVADTSIGHNLGVGKEDLYNDGIIDEENKTLFEEGLTSNDFLTKGKPLPYNYFQNSNLSAWKVWYCLDNDKSRFAWAVDSLDGTVVSINTDYLRDTSKDNDFDGYYGWTRPAHGDLSAVTRYTTTKNPQVGDTTFDAGKVSPVPLGEVVSVQTEGTGLQTGRGVIYRLIDEWNNDVPYDFKNILYLRKLTDGEIDAQGSDTYIPTFCLYDIGNDEYKDASIFAINYKNDEGHTKPCFNNFIGSIVGTDFSIDSGTYVLPLTVWISKVKNNDTGYSVTNNTVYTTFNCNIVNGINGLIILYGCNTTFIGNEFTIIKQNKRVVWETIS